MKKEKIKIILRWIVLPLSIPLIFIAMYWISYAIGKWSFRYISVNVEKGSLLDSIILVVSTILGFIFTVEISTRIAPYKKNIVEKIVLLLFLVIGVIIITISLINWNTSYITSIISNTIIIGYSIYGLIINNKNEK